MTATKDTAGTGAEVAVDGGRAQGALGLDQCQAREPIHPHLSFATKGELYCIVPND